MIGRVRFVLASLVVMNHLYLPTANRVGAHAVTAFYMISGYLMTKVLHETYGLDARGCGRFMVNRCLRIYPPYWIFLGLSLLLLWWFPTTFGQTYSNMQLPQTAYDYIRNLTLYDLANAPQIVIPPGWTLTVEMFFYVAMPLLLARTRAGAMVWLIVSVAITVWLIRTEPRFGPRYTPPHAASVFFAAGSVIYFFYSNLVRTALPKTAAWLLLGVFGVLPLLTDWMGLPPYYVGFYGAAILFVPILITSIGQVQGDLDRWLGDLAYPVFITHVFAGGVIRIMFPAAINPLSLRFLLSSFLLCLVISAAFVRWSDRRLEPLRRRIRLA